MERSEGARPPAVEIFHARDATDFVEDDMMESGPPDTAELAEVSGKLIAEGLMEGSRLRVLFRRKGGFNLTHVWFKSGFPLPSHSHSTPCLYYITAGSLTMGSQKLGPGDGFYLEADAPYLYVPGPQGVELLEFRAADKFDIRARGRNPKWWSRAIETLRRVRPAWASEAPPSGRLTGR